MNRKIFKFLLAFFLLLISVSTARSQTSEALAAFLKNDNLRHAAVGFKLVDLQTGKTLVAHNDNIALTPASNMKIVTTAAAIINLKPDFRYRTPLSYSGTIKNAVLNGNLYIEGAGDPTLGSDFAKRDKTGFLHNWLNAIKALGITGIDGDIVVLDQLFGYDGFSMKWLLEDIGSTYAQGVYGVSIFDNLHSPDDIILDPGLFLANYFRNFLLANNIPVKGKATTYRIETQNVVYIDSAVILPEHPTEISAYVSPPLSDIVREINVHSNNHYAEHIFRKLTEKINIRSFFQTVGLDSTALIMWDGSGLSPQDAVSAGYLTDVLAYMYRRQGGRRGAFYQSLPVVGKEGTVSSLLNNGKFSGVIRAKSGSISGVQSYSGYIERNGNTYAFSLIINNFSGKHREIRKIIERFFVEQFSFVIC
jgi:D-alanyl-D-alanine carboxypeptidase/D-alanyl-D-alanine-endopeptidase (penicillin-binding protein 4)